MNAPRHQPLLAILLLAALLASCQRTTPTPTAIPPAPARTLPATPPTRTPIAPGFPTATSVLFSGGGNPTGLPGPALDTPAPDPLRFVFPTPAQAPVSAWRPPLYPVPWAPTPYDHFFFARPIAADEVNWPKGDYRYGGEFWADIIHSGVDIPAPTGTPTLAAGPGKVIHAGYGAMLGNNDPEDPYGLAVIIRHDFGYQGQALFTLYGHLSQVDVAKGQHVETGDLLGLVGTTGRVTGPHLHFEVRLGQNQYGATRNPELWTSPPIGWGVLAGRILTTDGYPVYGQDMVVTNPATGQRWYSRSYGQGAVNSDPYYRENITVGDLPAGVYDLYIAYNGEVMETQVEVFAGMVSTFVFRGFTGFSIQTPTAPGANFDPFATPTPTPTPSNLSAP